MVRHDEIAGPSERQSNTFAVKLIAFYGFGGASPDLSGALFAAYVRFLTPEPVQ